MTRLAGIGILALVASSSAQRPPVYPLTLHGRIVRVRQGDTTGVAGAQVIIHRVTVDTQGPVDSLHSGPGGRFSRPLRADSGVIYLVSARWDGIEYFGAPLRFGSREPPAGLTVVVSDTSSTAPVVTSARHLVITAPGSEGMRGIVDLVVLQNDGPDTRVGRDDSLATWTIRIPLGVINLRVAQSDFADDALRIVGDTLRILAPIPPGIRQLTLEYGVPAARRRLLVPVDEAVPTVNLLAEESSVRVEGALARRDTQTVGRRQFTRWTGSAPPGTVLTVVFPGEDPLPPWVLPVLVSGLGIALFGRGARTWRSTRVTAETSPPARSAQCQALVQRIAELDLAHRGGAGVMGGEEWQSYQAERAALKRELEALLPDRK